MRNPFLLLAVSTLLALPLARSSQATARPTTAAPDGAGISLSVGLGTDPTEGACGTDITLEVTRGDQINYCYVVTNESTTTLNFHTLADDLNGPIFTAQPITLAPGASYQYNRIITATDSESPTATWTAYDVHPDYVYSTNAADPDRIFGNGFDGAGNTPTYAFEEISQTGTDMMLNDDDALPATLPFQFTFYGQTSDEIVVSNNGGILFGIDGGFLTPRNLALPQPHVGPAILPFWTDIYQSIIGDNVYYQAFGEAPNRHFIVEWKNLPVSEGGETNGATWEVIFYEGSNNLLFQYADTDVGDPTDPSRSNGLTTTIGIQAGDDQTFLQYSYLEASVTGGTAILFAPSTPVTYSATQQTVLDVGAPIIGTDPASFVKSIAAGATSTDTLTIANTGDRDLIWNIGEIQPRAHFPPVSRLALPIGDPYQARIGLPPARSGSVKALDTANHAHSFAPSVPAFADELYTSTLVGLDAAAPQTLKPIGDSNGFTFFAGDFKGEDFSTLYAIDFRTFDLYAIDTASGGLTRIETAEVPPGAGADAWNGMGWDAATNTMFAVTSSGRTPESYLMKIDLSNAATTLIGTITGVGDPGAGTAIADVAIDSTGHMYGVDVVTDTLVAIDKTTGEASTIGSIGFDVNFAADLDFDDYTNTLYLSAFNGSTGQEEMYTLNTETGLGTLVSPISNDPTVYALGAFAIAQLGGVCAYPGDVPWLSYDTTSGTTAPGATAPIAVTFDASALAAGTYSADICIYNNDLTNKRLAVPVTLTVQ